MGLFSKKAYVGLDLGHYRIKAAQLERTANGWKVSRMATAPTPSDTIKDGVVVDAPVLGLAIKQLLKSAHITATSATIAVSGGSVVVRQVKIPKMAEASLRKSIKFEASRYVPNSVEDSYIEFEIVGDADEQNMNVIVAAAPKDIVDSRVSACNAAGLDVEAVELAAFATYRAIVESDHRHDWSDKTIALVDVGASTTNMSVISKGSFSMTRAIPAGGQVLTDALMSYFKLSESDAELGKSQLDISVLLEDNKTIENPPLRVLHSHLDDHVREVRRSINYWQSQQGEGPTQKHIDALILCGGGAKLPGLATYFEHKLGVKTLALDIFDNPRILNSTPFEEDGMGLGIAIGLAMATQTKVSSSKASKVAAQPHSPEPEAESVEVETPKTKRAAKPKSAKAAKAEAPTLAAEPAPSEAEATEPPAASDAKSAKKLGIFGGKARSQATPDLEGESPEEAA